MTIIFGTVRGYDSCLIVSNSSEPGLHYLRFEDKLSSRFRVKGFKVGLVTLGSRFYRA